MAEYREVLWIDLSGLGDNKVMPDEQIRALLQRGEEDGCLNLSQFSEFVQEHELDGERLAQLYDELETRGIELTDDCARLEAASQPS